MSRRKLERRPKLLVAEDDPDTLKIILMVLSRSGFEVITAEDGHEALKKAIKERPAAILLDIIMPKLDGIELCVRLRQRKITKDIPIGFLTARTDTVAFRQVLQQGAVFYITKPFSPEKLVNFVKLLTRPSEQGAEEERLGAASG